MATKAIKVQVDERLAGEISDKAVKAWHATNYSNGKNGSTSSAASKRTTHGVTYSNATEAVEWVAPRTVMTQLVIAFEGLK